MFTCALSAIQGSIWKRYKNYANQGDRQPKRKQPWGLEHSSGLVLEGDARPGGQIPGIIAGLYCVPDVSVRTPYPFKGGLLSMSQRRKQRRRAAMQRAQFHNQEAVKPDTWLSDCRAHILSCQAGGAGRDTGKGVPSAVREEGGTGELSGVAGARREGTCHGSRLWRGGLVGGRKGRAWDPTFFRAIGVSGGPAALSTVSAAG